jgi:hypothetical protein
MASALTLFFLSRFFPSSKVERNKAIMARLLSGEITAFEGEEKQHVRTLVKLMLAHATKPRVSGQHS